MTADTQAQGDLLKLARASGAHVEYEFSPSESKLLRVTFAPGNWDAFAAALQGRGTQEGEPSDAPFGRESDDAPAWMRKKASDIAELYGMRGRGGNRHKAEIVEAMQAAAIAALAQAQKERNHG